MMYRPYGNLLNNIVYGPGTLIANAGLSSKLIKYVNTKLVEDKIEADYKNTYNDTVNHALVVVIPDESQYKRSTSSSK